MDSTVPAQVYGGGATQVTVEASANEPAEMISMFFAPADQQHEKGAQAIEKFGPGPKSWTIHMPPGTGGYLEAPAWAAAADLILDDSTLPPGHAIGKYRVVREIARGGMGVVYCATDQVLGRTVALKALPADYTHDVPRRQRLVREARLAAQLSHRAIATVYELVEDSEQLYIASEFVPGITLRRELQDGALPPTQLLGTLVEIAGALAAAHAHNIIHRDLKPENIIRREDGQIKVLDFGLARALPGQHAATTTGVTEHGMIAGTPGYMAPEVLDNRPADARSDIFVFGILGWELAAGLHPLGKTPHSQMARLHDIAGGAEPPLTGSLAVAGLEDILRRCAARDPERRYQTADALLDDLRKLQRIDSSPAIAGPRPRLWWWQFHQVSIAVIVASTPLLGWMARRWTALPRGTWVFLAVLALATASVTIRLNLLFTSRVNRDLLREHRRRVAPWLLGIEAALCTVLLWSAAMIGSAAATELQEAAAAVLMTLAIVIAAALAVIEPATMRGAGLQRGQNETGP